MSVVLVLRIIVSWCIVVGVWVGGVGVLVRVHLYKDL